MNLTVEEMKEIMNDRKVNTILDEDTFELIKGKVLELGLDDEGRDLIDVLMEDYRRLSKELVDQLAQKEDASEVDALMHVNNPTSMLKVIQKEWEGSKRYHSPTSLIVFSVDQLNENGDEMTESQKQKLTIELSEIINKSTRLTDTFGRLDDEKFIIVVPTTNNIQAAWLSAKLRDSIAAYEFDVDSKVSCSFGVADSGDSMDMHDWVVIAEEAYHRAVELGGNTVVDYETIIEK